MLWICLVVGGAVLGYLLSYDEWTGFLIGALMGWAVWAGIRVRVLGRRSEAQLQQIIATGKNIETLQQRLGALERQPAPPSYRLHRTPLPCRWMLSFCKRRLPAPN